MDVNHEKPLQPGNTGKKTSEKSGMSLPDSPPSLLDDEFMLFCFSKVYERWLQNIQIEMLKAVNKGLEDFKPLLSTANPDNMVYLRPVSAAMLLNVSTDTLKRYEKQGKLNSYFLPGGQLRYLKSEVLALAEK